LKYKNGGKHPPNIESIIAKEIEFIRPDRSSLAMLDADQLNTLFVNLIDI